MPEGAEVKIDLESLAVLETRLRAELETEFYCLRTADCLRKIEGDTPAMVEQKARHRRDQRQNVRVLLAGLRAIQLARRTVSAMNELEARYGVKVSSRRENWYAKA